MDENKDCSISRWVFFKAAMSGHAWLWAAGVVSVVFFAADFSQQFIKPKVNPDLWKSGFEWLTVIGSWPTYIWAIIVLLILLAGSLETSFRICQAARKRGDLALARVADYELPKLKLLWMPTESPYRWWDHTQKPPALYLGFGVKNTSGVTIDNVKIQLQKVEPEPDSSYAPCPLRLRHNILPGNAPIREFSLAPGEERIAQLMVQSETINFFWMLTAIDTIPDWRIPIRPYRFQVCVFSSAAGPVACSTYELYKDGTLWNMREIIP